MKNIAVQSENKSNQKPMQMGTKKITKYVEVYVYDNGTELREQRFGLMPIGYKADEAHLRKSCCFPHEHCRERIYYTADGVEALTVTNRNFKPKSSVWSGKDWNFRLTDAEYDSLRASGYNWE